MMRRGSPGREQQLSLLQTAATILVVMKVPQKHELLELKRRLNWPAIREIVISYLRKAGKNVDGGAGRPLDVDLYVPMLVLGLLKNKNSRQLEEYLAENAVARIFVDRENDSSFQVRDHSNIARIMDALGAEGIGALNGLVIREATELGFADPTILSGDTTAQELPIGYPNEPGILKGLAQRCKRALSRLAGKGKRKLKDLVASADKLVWKAKEHHLFAKGKEAKQRILTSMVRETKKLLSGCEELAQRLTRETDRVVQSARSKLLSMIDVGKTLLPQIVHWMKTGTVAKGKILSAGLREARAIVRNKAGKKVEFGLQYLLGVLGGGYVFAELIERPTGETKMPAIALAQYRDTLGADQTPDMFVYDRGGWSAENVESLKAEGIKKVAIQPKGRARWRVHGRDRARAMSERGKTEGSIGTLKGNKYGFNKPRERRPDTLRAAGQRSVLSMNLNKFQRDLMKREANATA